MRIQFSNQEIAIIRSYLDGIKAENRFQKVYQEFPEWNIVFLLLRKLLAYGVHSAVQTGELIDYEKLQKMTQKPDDMVINTHLHLDLFENLIVNYCAGHSGIVSL